MHRTFKCSKTGATWEVLGSHNWTGEAFLNMQTGSVYLDRDDAIDLARWLAEFYGFSIHTKRSCALRAEVAPVEG